MAQRGWSSDSSPALASRMMKPEWDSGSREIGDWTRVVVVPEHSVRCDPRRS
jgi:hypothetical protein